MTCKICGKQMTYVRTTYGYGLVKLHVYYCSKCDREASKKDIQEANQP